MNHATSDGTAQAGSDYTAASGILTIEARVSSSGGGALSQTVEVTAVSDEVGHQETPTSVAAAAVETVPLTVSVENSPASDNGTDAFTFNIWFSGEVKLSFRILSPTPSRLRAAPS